MNKAQGIEVQDDGKVVKKSTPSPKDNGKQGWGIGGISDTMVLNSDFSILGTTHPLTFWGTTHTFCYQLVPLVL